MARPGRPTANLEISAEERAVLERFTRRKRANRHLLSVDEKSQIQALARATPVLPMDIGIPERRTPNYVPHGTVDLFAALDVATGQVLGRCFGRHRPAEFLWLNMVERFFGML
jgi:hypothetical protein